SADGCGALAAVFAVGAGEDGLLWAELVAEPERRGGAAAAGVFPLGLARQPIAAIVDLLVGQLGEPQAEGLRLLPVDGLDGMFGPAAAARLAELRRVPPHHLRVLPLGDGGDGEVERASDVDFVGRA